MAHRFMGTYRPKLDEKGRLFLPAKFRDALAGGVVVTQAQDRCLWVWPPEVFDVEADRIQALPMSSKSARQQKRILFSGADDAVPDKQGRISIAAHLRDYAALEKDVVVTGNGDRLEIWSPTNWDSYQGPATDAFADLDDDDED